MRLRAAGFLARLRPLTCYENRDPRPIPSHNRSRSQFNVRSRSRFNVARDMTFMAPPFPKTNKEAEDIRQTRPCGRLGEGAARLHEMHLPRGPPNPSFHEARWPSA